MVPGNSATVEEALAITGGSPAAIIAGKLTKEPPPAIAFIAPASSPATASGPACCMRAGCPGGHRFTMRHGTAPTEVIGLEY